MSNKAFLVVGSLVMVGTAFALGCEGKESASADPQTTTQAQSATTIAAADGGARPGHGRLHGPPPAAFEACSGKTAGTACSVTIHDQAKAGKCVSPPPGAPDSRIACLPDDMPPHGPPGGSGHGPHHGPPPGPPPAEVFAACDGKAADAACSVTLGDHTIEGTCRPPPPGVSETRLGCAPPHPAAPPTSK